MHYRNLIDLTNRLSPDIVGLNDFTQALPSRVGAIPKAIPHNHLEEAFWACWKALGGPPLEREVRFHPTRRWRFDFVVSGTKVAFEVQGGLNSPNSGHRSRRGVARDYEKHNAALLLGWQVFFVTAKAIDDAALVGQLISYATGAIIR